MFTVAILAQANPPIEVPPILNIMQPPVEVLKPIDIVPQVPVAQTTAPNPVTPFVTNTAILPIESPPSPTVNMPATVAVAAPYDSNLGASLNESINTDTTKVPPATRPSSSNEPLQPMMAANSSVNDNPEWREYVISNRMVQMQLVLENERALVDYTKKYYQYQADNLVFVHEVFIWNGRQSILIFIIAHILLVLGVGAAFFEFRNAMKLREKAREKDEIKIELEGVALKTSLRAIWLLASAFVFYFLYIKFVYTITLLH